MSPTTLVILMIVIAFVLVYVFGGRLAFLSNTPRSVWLSGAGGVSVAYVFMNLLPELAARLAGTREVPQSNRIGR